MSLSANKGDVKSSRFPTRRTPRGYKDTIPCKKDLTDWPRPSLDKNNINKMVRVLENCRSERNCIKVPIVSTQ